MERQKWVVGVDFGGTNTKVGLVSASGRVVRTAVFSSCDIASPARFLEAISGAAESLARSVGMRPAQLRGLCVGAPGPVDVERGVIHSMVNVPGWREVPLGPRLERRLRCRCLIENDVHLFALGEWRFGAGRGARALVCLTLGTGVGGGLIFDGRLYRGAVGAAGELGHMVIDPRGRRCACGARGCLEAQVGTAALLSLGRRAIRQGSEPLCSLVRQARGRLTPELLAAAARRGDRAARQVWVDIGHSLGVGLGNLINLLNPDRIVLGGGIANAWSLFSPGLLRTVRAQAMDVPARAVRIVRAQLGSHAGIVGAAVLLAQQPGGGQ